MATVQRRGDTYRITASAGYDTEGRQIRKSMTWRPAPGMTGTADCQRAGAAKGVV